MHKMNRQEQKQRSFERLETRSLMAGNVTAAVVGGNLTITGDDVANYISLRELGDTGKWEIVGLKTSINGNAPRVVTAPVTGSITINLNGGADRLNIHDGNVPGHLFITMGDGDDTASLSNLQLGTYLHFEGNDGNDAIAVKNVQVTDPSFAFFSTIDMQNGNDRAVVRNFNDQDLSLTMGSGDDHLKMTNCAFLGGPYQRLQIDTGDGSDTATLKHDVTGPLNVDVGTGKNSLNLTNCTADTANCLNLGSGSISGEGNDFGKSSISPGLGHLAGEFNI
jgi:hypothetical protein